MPQNTDKGNQKGLNSVPPEPKKNNNTALLCPKFFKMVQIAISAVKDETGFDVHVFEGFRSAERQAWLWASSRERPGPWLTNARPGQSAHEYGLACDLVAKIDSKWSWDEKLIPYGKFVEIYRRCGLKSAAPKETCHVEFIGPFKASELADFVRIYGLQALWTRVLP